MSNNTEIICPNVNCGYKGEPKKESRGSIATAIILLFLFILPGLLYILFMQGYRYKCPKCNLQLSSDI